MVLSFYIFKNINFYDVDKNILSNDVKGNPMIGNKNAVNEIIIFSDYSCPYCKNFHKKTLPIIEDKFVNKNKARVIIVNVDILGDNSEIFARVGNSLLVKYPQKFWEYFNSVYENQNDNNSKEINEKDINGILSKVQIPENKIKEIRDEYIDDQGEANRLLKRNDDAYKKYATPYVPAVYVNGHFIEDSYSVDEIESYLK